LEWPVEYTDEFGAWWDGLSVEEQVGVDASVGLPARYGPTRKFPHCSGWLPARTRRCGSCAFSNEGRPCRVLYAFDPARTALLLLGGDKTGDDRWYEKTVPRGPSVQRALTVAGKEGRT